MALQGGGTKTLELTGTPSQSRIECGFAPRIIMVFDGNYNGNNRESIYYNKDLYVDKYQQNYNAIYQTANVAADGQLYNIDNTGFNMPYYSSFSANTYILVVE